MYLLRVVWQSCKIPNCHILETFPTKVKLSIPLFEPVYILKTMSLIDLFQ